MELRGRVIVIVSIVLVSLLLIILTFHSRRLHEYKNNTVKISSILSASIYLSELAGEKVFDVRENTDPEIRAKVKSLTKEGVKEYVTLGDQKSNHLIVGGLLSKWPNLHLRSEEVNSAAHAPLFLPLNNPEVMKHIKRDEEVDLNDITIWIDPLDATQEYTEGGVNPELLKYVMVMICIVVDEYPVAGVIHQPFVKDKNDRQGMTYWGWVDHGVSENLKKAKSEKRGGSRSSSEKLRIISSRSHAGNIKQLIESSSSDSSKIEQIVAAGSGYKTLQVVQNNADMYLHSTMIKKWDTCAGNAILNSVGGRMTTLSGQTINYKYKTKPEILDGLVATVDSSDHYTDFLRRINNAKKDQKSN